MLGWSYGVATLFFVRAVFDVSLNKFRNLSAGYISPNPKSIIDKLEKRLITFIVSRTTKHVIVNNEMQKVAVWVKIFYIIIGIALLTL